MNAKKIVVDTDPGIDDAVALAYLAAYAQEQIRGVTITYGNCSLEWATSNAALILALSGAERVPIVPGASQPLCRRPEYASDTHGEDGFGYARQVIKCNYQSAYEIAGEWGPDALVRWAKEGDITLICLGPLTNLALALARDRHAMMQGLKQVIVMGGSAGAPGNTTPVSEFNFWCDPEAAKAVLASGLPLRLVGLDVTRCMFFSRLALKKLADSTRTEALPLVDTLVAAMRFYQEFHLKAEGLLGCIVNDPLAVMLSIHPEMGECKPMYVHVECSDGYTRGQSVCDRFGVLNRKPNAQVYLQVESRAAMHQVWDRIAPGVLAADDF